MPIGEGCYHVVPALEPDCWDDEAGDGYHTLSRWGDREYAARKNRWTENTTEG